MPRLAIRKLHSAAITNNESTSQSSRFTSVHCFIRLFFNSISNPAIGDELPASPPVRVIAIRLENYGT